MVLLDIIRRIVYKKKYRLKKVGKNVLIADSAFEGYNSVFANAEIRGSYIGLCTYISRETILHSTKVGRYCSIADHVMTCIGNHPTSVYVSTHPSFYYDTTLQIGYSFHQEKKALFNTTKYPMNEYKYQIIIGNDVWIGSHVLIMSGVSIGDGAIIAAGAVVTKDVEPYSIVGGVPARKIKSRFEETEIQRLMAIQWWNNPLEEIQQKYSLFSDVHRFFENY